MKVSCEEKCLNSTKQVYIQISNWCLKDYHYDSKLETLSNANVQLVVEKTWKHVIVSIGASIAISFGVLFIFRYAIKQIVIGFCYGMVILLFLLSIGCFITYLCVNSKQSSQLESVCIIVGIVSAILGSGLATVVFLHRDKIILVAKIFNEASRAIGDLLTVLFVPILTITSQLSALALFTGCCLIIFTNGDLKKYHQINSDEMDHRPLILVLQLMKLRDIKNSPTL
jgi:Plasma-membrane choline transporter